MTNFEKWDSDYRMQRFDKFNNNPNGILWLKTRAICRVRQLRHFLQDNNIFLKSTRIVDMNKELFEVLEKKEDALLILDKFLSDLNHEWYEIKGVDYETLKEDLYKVREYSWGGDYNNSLDKYLVSHFVKNITNYRELESKKSAIAENSWLYVQNSWYNNWTSFLIESLFKRNKRVVSAVGEIKGVDFFINDYPIDLKVTYFPNQFMEEKLKERLGKNSLSWLKFNAKKVGISHINEGSATMQSYILKEKLYERGYPDVIERLRLAQREIIEEASRNPEELIKWLYENQGEMRFGAENRLFIILVDSSCLEESWKLKRAFSIIEPKVAEYIELFSSQTLKEINFTFKKQSYTSLSDAVFIIR